MANITLKGNPIHTSGELPKVGGAAPKFSLVAHDLSEKSLGDYKGKTIVLSIFPSIDTPVCATSVRKFNESAVGAGDVVVLNVSKDLPFATKRYCAAEGLDNVESLSAFRCEDFGQAYGISIVDGPLKGLFGRAVIVIDPNGKVVYEELVPEIAQEPNYEAALAIVRQPA